jgi:glycine/D-amino acid oxidase-like deaminating enzyme
MRQGPTVAVLGAGIMGSATALMLARRGARVTLVDAAPHPFSGASRWNEGKIHLGHLYAADPSLRTARRLLPGGLAFKSLVEALVGTSLDAAVTTHDDTYLVHRDSVVGADAMGGYLDAVTSLARSHPQAGRYLVDVSDARMERLSAKQLDTDYDTTLITAGYRVPERSVDTQWLAERFVQALAAESGIEPLMRTRVTAVRRTGPAQEAPLLVDIDDGATEGPFDFVVNALWEGRLAIDAAMAQPLPPVYSHRYRLSAFVRTQHPVVIPSTVVATGPFGDVKSYSPTSFYLSWYPSGLVAQGCGVAPPAEPALDDAERSRILEEVLERLGRIIPAVRRLGGDASELRLEGGWVYAVGEGSLADEKSGLHRRDRIGIERAGSYLSVDTGKYSIAPWLALQIADAIVPP